MHETTRNAEDDMAGYFACRPDLVLVMLALAERYAEYRKSQDAKVPVYPLATNTRSS